ncbi:hypothetical protein KI387_000253, partial [Taxus chinensis]
MVGLIPDQNRVYLLLESRVKSGILRVVHNTSWADHPGHFIRNNKGEGKKFSFSPCLWNMMKENASMICFRKDKFEGNYVYSLYGLLTHDLMRELKEVWAKGYYGKLAAVHMVTEVEKDGSIFQFYDPMMSCFCTIEMKWKQYAVADALSRMPPSPLMDEDLQKKEEIGAANEKAELERRNGHATKPKRGVEMPKRKRKKAPGEAMRKAYQGM